MISSVRRHLSYANVTATIALLFAMSGSALAASKEFTAEPKSREFNYVITSIDQLSPSVRAKLIAAGKPGRTGPAGAPGATGSQGPVGPSGAAGTAGAGGLRGEPGLSILSESEQETLRTVLPYVKYVASGVGGKPTIQFSGANVQIVNGEGSTNTINGAGNLIVGYDEDPSAQTGSHNLVIGPEQRYTSYGSILGGRNNKALGPYDFVTGIANTAGNEGASVSGGFENTAAFKLSSIFGGKDLSTKAEYEAIP
jgi:hypothetical protein